MGKNKANQKINTGELTIGELNKILADYPRDDKPAKLNSGMTRKYLAKCFDAGLKGQEEDVKISPRGIGYSPGLVLLARNILRECG